jgi:hypothetical protein
MRLILTIVNIIVSRLEMENQSINDENNEMRQITDSASQGKILIEKKYKATANQLQVSQIYNWVQTCNDVKMSKEMEYQLREQLKLNLDLENSKRDQIEQNQELLKNYEEKESQVF